MRSQTGNVTQIFTVDPSVRFGRPSIAGVRTEVIWERYEADGVVSSLAGP